MSTELRPGRPMWLLLAALMVIELVAAFETGMVFAAMATFIRAFGDPVRVGWLVTAYLLVAGASAAIGGRLGDIYGRRRLLIIVMALACIGSLISGATDQLAWVLTGRTMQGVVGAALPLCYGIARENLPKARVATAVGIITGTASVGAGLGLVLGGVVVDNLSWQWLFHISAIGTAVAVTLLLVVIPRSPVRRFEGRLDVLGGLLFVPAILGVLLAVSKAPAWGWLDGRTLSLLAGSVVLLALWVRVELRHPHPLIDVRLLANRQVALANILMGLIAVGAMQAQVLALLLQQPAWTGVGLGLSATVAGLIKVPANFAGALGAPWAGSIASRHGARLAMLFSLAILCVGWLILTFNHSAPWIAGLVMLLTGIGIAAAFTSVPNLVMEVVPADRTSEATGLSAVIRNTTQAVGSQLVALSLASSMVSDPSKGSGSFPSQQAFTLTFALVAGSCCVAFLVALSLPRRPQPMSGRAVSASGSALSNALG